MNLRTPPARTVGGVVQSVPAGMLGATTWEVGSAVSGMSERSSDTQQGFRPSTDERTCPLGDLDSAMVPAGSADGRW